MTRKERALAAKLGLAHRRIKELEKSNDEKWDRLLFAKKEKRRVSPVFYSGDIGGAVFRTRIQTAAQLGFVTEVRVENEQIHVDHVLRESA